MMYQSRFSRLEMEFQFAGNLTHDHALYFTWEPGAKTNIYVIPNFKILRTHLVHTKWPAAFQSLPHSLNVKSKAGMPSHMMDSLDQPLGPFVLYPAAAQD